MSQSLVFVERKFEKVVKFKNCLNTPDTSEILYYFEFDLKIPDNFEAKTEHFLFCPQNKVSPQDKFSDLKWNLKITQRKV